MAIVMRMHWPEVTPDLYDEVRHRVGWEWDPAPGGIVHVAWFDHGLRVWDVWDTAESFGAFHAARLGPATDASGIPTAPDVEVLACHHHQVVRVVGGRLLVETGSVPGADAYDAVTGEVDVEGRPPTGAVCHVAAENPDGTIDTVTVWTHAAASVDFATYRMKPVLDRLGVPHEIDGNAPPFHLVHAVFAP